MIHRLRTSVKKVSKSFLIGLLIFGFISSSLGTILIESKVLANGWYSGYFFGGGFTSTRWNVINDGLPTWVTSKALFISYIESKWNPANPNSQDSTGAAYIIQTMRGGTDHGYPGADDIADWKQRINNPAVTASWGWYTAGINSARMNYSSPHRDVSAYYGDGHAYYSYLFYVNGNVSYVVKQICANPMGALGGLPSYQYDLTPGITGSPSSSEGGQTINLTPTVNNSGPTGSDTVNWQITSFTVNDGDTPPTGATNTTPPITYYASPGNNIRNERSVNASFPVVGVNSIGNQAVVIGDYAIGTRVCYVLSLSPYTHAASGWRHSNPFCVVIAKQPKVQILGGDLIVGKGLTSTIVTPATRKSVNGTDRTYGSWGEYGVIATGLITGFGSGAGYSGGNTSPAYCDASYLTFTNAGTSTCAAASSTKGGYALAKQLPDIAGRFIYTIPISGGAINVSNVSSGVYGIDPQLAQTITVSANPGAGGQIQPGRSIIISAPSGTVNITSNIEYTGAALSRAADIPQVVIIADTINIADSVTNIDAWLVATGTNGNINTCASISNPVAQLNANVCNQKLTINGPVVAKHLYLYRTAGSDTGAGSGNPAEVFNLRPDAYLWATNYTASAGRLQTVSTKELPPRF